MGMMSNNLAALKTPLASEVLELGETLFELALETRAHTPETEEYPSAEIQAATQEFFTALRLLLRIEE
jgi:hypothetical protein